MTGKMSRRIVVDADVARASGESEHPVSSSCREILQTILKICHRIVMNRRLAREWDRHQSRFAKSWLASMRSKRKVIMLGSEDLLSLEDPLREAPLSERMRAAILKDQHLLELAIAADHVVISRDDQARAVVATAIESVRGLENLHWVNPVDPGSIEWLQSGARKPLKKPSRKR